jgi:putative membrane protein
MIGPSGWGWYWGFGGGLLESLIAIALIVLVVWGIVSLIRHADSRPTTAIKQTPLDIAKERYAKGQITKEQFDQIKKDLNQK